MILFHVAARSGPDAHGKYIDAQNLEKKPTWSVESSLQDTIYWSYQPHDIGNVIASCAVLFYSLNKNSQFNAKDSYFNRDATILC